MNDHRGRVYRSRRGMVFGVCRGVSEHFDIPVFWVRVAAVMFLMFSGVFPAVVVYFVAALMMTPEPIRPFHTPEERDFYDSYADSPSRAVARLKRTFERIDRRIRRMEDRVTDSEYDWEQRLNS